MAYYNVQFMGGKHFERDTLGIVDVFEWESAESLAKEIHDYYIAEGEYAYIYPAGKGFTEAIETGACLMVASWQTNSDYTLPLD